MISGHPKSTGIPRVDGLPTGPPDLGCHNFIFFKIFFFTDIYIKTSTDILPIFLIYP